MTANYIIEGAAWRGPRPRRLTRVPVGVTSELLSRIRACGIPVSQFLREAGEKALDAALPRPSEGKGE